MPTVDLHFPVLGDTLPTDHGYTLYSAIAERLPELHQDSIPLAIATIRGTYIGGGTLRLDQRSWLRLRLATEHIPAILPLAGKSLAIMGHKIRVGVPRVRALIPAPALLARMVTIKGFTEPEPFLEAARRQLDQLGINPEAQLGIPLIQRGPRAGEPCRRVLRIKTKRVVGFALQVTGLTAAESVALQEAYVVRKEPPRGLGGRHHMGCGFFVPLREKVP